MGFIVLLLFNLVALFIFILTGSNKNIKSRTKYEEEILRKTTQISGLLLRSEDGVWYVRRIVKSKDTPALDIIEKIPLHPLDSQIKELDHKTSYIPHQIEFKIEEVNSLKYARLKS